MLHPVLYSSVLLCVSAYDNKTVVHADYLQLKVTKLVLACDVPDTHSQSQPNEVT